MQRASLLRSISADSPAEEALDHYIQLRTVAATPGALSARYVSDNTMRMFVNHREALLLFFRGMRIKDIHWYHMRSYQAARTAGAEPFIRFRRPQDAMEGGIGKTPCAAKPQQCNQELGTLKKLKMLSGCWTSEDEAYYEQLTPRNNEIPRALSPEEQRIWIDMGLAQERWMIVHHWSTVAIDTTMSTNEQRGLRLGDLNMHQRVVTVPWPSAKNKYRKRSIALENADCLWSFDRLLARAYDMGARDPQHYLFPFGRRGGQYDPTRPMTGSGIKRQWNEMRAATGLDWVDMYGMRHTGATRMAENGVPIDVIMARMGHATEEMRQHYTQIGISAQRRWLRPQPYTQHMYAPPVAQWPQQQQVQQFAPQHQRPELPDYLRYMRG